MTADEILIKYGFALTKERKHAIEYVNAYKQIILYLLPTAKRSVVLDPEMAELIDLAKYNTKLYYNSNMVNFPQRDNGSGLIHYGVQVALASDRELEELLILVCGQSQGDEKSSAGVDGIDNKIAKKFAEHFLDLGSFSVNYCGQKIELVPCKTKTLISGRHGELQKNNYFGRNLEYRFFVKGKAYNIAIQFYKTKLDYYRIFIYDDDTVRKSYMWSSINLSTGLDKNTIKFELQLKYTAPQTDTPEQRERRRDMVVRALYANGIRADEQNHFNLGSYDIVADRFVGTSPEQLIKDFITIAIYKQLYNESGSQSNDTIITDRATWAKAGYDILAPYFPEKELTFRYRSESRVKSMGYDWEYILEYNNKNMLGITPRVRTNDVKLWFVNKEYEKLFEADEGLFLFSTLEECAKYVRKIIDKKLLLHKPENVQPKSKKYVDRFVFCKMIDAEKNVSVVQDRTDGKFYIQKEYTTFNKAVFERLKELKPEGIPEIISLCEKEGVLITVEEYIKGENYNDYLEENGPLGEQEAIRIALDLCDITEQLHRLNPPIIHRDIKPANIMRKKDGKTVLIDFNVSKNVNSDYNEDTILWGTKYFAAPEQVGGFGSSDNRTDIYGIGATVNYLLTKLHTAELLAPGKLRSVIEKCTRLEKAQRYQNVAELRQALLACCD